MTTSRVMLSYRAATVRERFEFVSLQEIAVKPLFNLTAILLLWSAAAWCGDWNPRLAADYLDAREKAWFAWPVSKSAGGNCVSCHTNMSYLMARPALRKLRCKDAGEASGAWGLTKARPGRKMREYTRV